jgi:DNA polymerase
VQPHNFPRGTVKGVEHYIPFVKSGDAAAIDCMHPVMEVLSSMLRSAMVAAPGNTLFTADFAAIEARVLAWLAGETGLLDDFRNGVDTYRGLAADIYGVPKESIAKTSQMRLVGKQAVLGLGYQMGASKFVDSCKTTYDLDIPADLAKLTVNTYRAKYKEIARMWAALEAAVVRAVSEPGTFVKLRQCDVSFQVLGEWMYCTLPSGRQLHYHRPMVAEVELPWSTPERPALKDQVSVMGLDSYTHKWTRYALYGGLLTENIVQAVSRDILAEAMFRVEEAGYPVVLTVHDEVVSERKKGTGSLSEFEGLMRVVPEWAAGCPVDVEGWTGARYRK